MRMLGTKSLGVAMAVIFAVAARGVAQESKPAAPQTGPRLLPEHECLTQFAGDWDVTHVLQLGDQKRTMIGTDQVKIISGGLYAMSTVRTGSPDAPFEGRGLIGYDPHKKKYIFAWVDATAAQPTFREGTLDPKTNTLTTTGMIRGQDGVPYSVRSVSTSRDKDHRSEIIYLTSEGGVEKPVGEITYVRRQKPIEAPEPKVEPQAVPLSGSWAADLVMESPGGPAIRTSGTETSELCCGGRWLWTELTFGFGGKALSVHQLLTYDPASKKCYALWTDAFDGGFDTAEGTSPDAKNRSMTGETYDETGARVKWTEVVTWNPDGTRTTVWQTLDRDGKPKDTVRVNYRRL
jgi:hypothetical protein